MSNLMQTLKGFRDFLPAQKRARDFVLRRIIGTFETFGFEPLETPTLEYAELLLGKYGDEADKLVYTFEDKGERKVGLRYDQTVPTARVLSQYQNDLPKYFRRYQTQNVFRADKPQKGRYREFTQCDIDIFGSSDTLADAEILACTYAAYKAVGFKEITLYVNDRQTLIATLSPFTNEKVDVFSVIQSIDKLDKQTPNEIIEELVAKGLDKSAANQAIEEIEKVAPSKYLSEIVDKTTKLGVPASTLVINPKLARGLDYYTGMIFEIKIPGYEVGSVGGGGRYDNLIGQLSGRSLPAVGVAFGFDRTVEAAQQLGIIPDTVSASQVLVTIFDEKTMPVALQTANELRQAGIATEVYPALEPLPKQLKLANQKQIPFVVIIGEDEIQKNVVTLKSLSSGEQQQLTIAEIIAQLQ